jgi:tetratricopeptide (TPR) repeat protein
LVTKKQPQAEKTLREIATQESISNRLDEETKALEEIETEINASEKANPDYIEAQKIYVRGFRNFQKGMYAQAVSSFETCLSIYPDHQLARRYKTLSENRLDELIDFHLTEARIHLENRKYDFCIANYKNVMSQSYDKNDKRFTEAKIGLSKCETLKRNQY